MLVGKVLKHIRIFNGYTQKKFAKKFNLSCSYISTIETNKKPPSTEVLKNYSDSFDISVSDILLFGEQYNNINGLKKNDTVSFMGSIRRYPVINRKTFRYG